MNDAELDSATHWVAFTARVHGGDIMAVTVLSGDTNLARSRLANPSVRRGWLQNGPGPSSARGAEEFVEISWDELIDPLGAELRRV